MTMHENASLVCATLKSKGHEAYVVGGACRDLVLGRVPKDFDIVTSALPAAVEEAFPGSFGVGKAFGIINVRLNGDVFEVATFRADSTSSIDGRRPESVEFVGTYEEDAARRDLTMNAIYHDPSTGVFHDPVGGKLDIENETIRFIGVPEDRLAEDRLRALRAIRFSAQLGFGIEPASWKALVELGHSDDPFNHLCEVGGVSWERIRDEFLKILCSSFPVKGVLLLKEAGFLHHIVPEFDSMWGCHQSPRWHQEGSCGVHTMLVLGNCLTKDPVDRLACFLHDIGKPATLELKDVDLEEGTWKYTNKGHDMVGARMSEVICQRLKLPIKLTEEVVHAVAQHMNAHSLRFWKTTWKIRRFLGHKFFPAVMRVAIADERGSISNEPNEPLASFVEEWTTRFPEMLPKPFVTGETLIKRGLKPNPKFAEILTEAYNHQLDGWDDERILKRVPRAH